MSNLEKFNSFEGVPLDILKACWEILRPYGNWKGIIMTTIPKESFFEFDRAVRFFASVDLQILKEIELDGEECLVVFSEGYDKQKEHGRVTIKPML